MPHSLVEIPRPEWKLLRDLYSSENRYASSYNSIQNCIEWVDQSPELDLKIYSLDGEWQDDGTFVAILPDAFIMFNTLSDNMERLEAALGCVDETRPKLMFGFRERVLPVVERLCEKNGFTKEDISTDGTFWYYISREEAEKFSTEPPEGLTVGPVELRHAKQIHSAWPHGTDQNLPFVELLIRFNDTVGAFDQQGNLVAWCLRLPLGSLGLLQVEKSHKRQGLGSLMVRCMAKKILSKGLEVTAPVVFKNVPSRTMFEKLGFTVVDKVYWTFIPAKKA